MANVAMSKLANLRIVVGMLVSAALASALSAQAQLQVDVGAGQQIRIVASDVSYGEILRTLEKKLGWEIEIPALADELKIISSVRIETTRPAFALAKLLEGSRLGYALLTEVNQSRSVKVVVTANTPGDASVTGKTATSSAIPFKAGAGSSSPPLAKAPAVPPNKSNAAVAGADTEQAESLSLSTMPLTDAVNAMGVPAGMSPADLGNTMTLPLSDAAKVMGVPPGVSSIDVGKTTTLPLPTGPDKHP